MKIITLILLVFCNTCFSQYIAHAGYARFNTISSWNFNNLIDSSANGKNLTLGGQAPPTVIDNAFGTGINGINFSGLSNAVAEGEKYSNIYTNYTFEFRITRDSTYKGVTQIIFGRWATGTGKKQYLCYIDSTNHINFKNDTTTTATSSSTITDSVPHTVIVELDVAVVVVSFLKLI